MNARCRASALEGNNSAREMKITIPIVYLLIVFFALEISACQVISPEPAVNVPGGDPTRGQGALLGYGCNSCHTIPGVSGTTATVGPPLTQFALRNYVAGVLPNTPDNLIKWIQDPQSIDPGTAMPNLGVSADAARDIAAYLYTLR